MNAFEKAKTARVSASGEMDWASAYEELLPKVYYYFCLRIGDRFEAEDLTAATFERAWRDRRRYRKDLGSFTNWLFGIARHVAIAYFRQNEQQPANTELSVEHVYRPTEEAAATQEEFDRLASMLSVLPEREREIFSLKYGAQFTNRSIAKIVRLSESNVGTILHRTVSHLREQLEDGK